MKRSLVKPARSSWVHQLDVTTSSLTTLNAIHAFTEQALSYGKDAESIILQGIAADPSCAIARAYAAAYYLSQESTVGKQQAIPHLCAAMEYAAEATEREQLYVQAILCWARGQVQSAIALHEQLAEQYPQDLLSVQQGQYHYFYLGDKGKLLQLAERVLPANPDNHYLLGMLAFGLEQCHQLTEAEAVARQAIAINPQDPWAHHAIAHVMETQGRIDEGIAWMERFAYTWEACNSMLYTHNWWHIALFYLAKGATRKVLSLYDQHVWGRARPETPKDQVGAISLLLRLEMQGVAVDERRWQELMPHLLPRMHEHRLPFQDLHYIYALARAGQAELANEMLASMESHSATLEPLRQAVWSEVALPAAHGLIAYAKADWKAAILHLQSVLPRLYQVGGSHTQRDLFNHLYLNAQRQHQRRLYQIISQKRGNWHLQDQRRYA